MAVTREPLALPGGSAAALISLNRPESLNPLDWESIRLLERELLEAEGDRDVRAILLTGRGRAFSAGGDLKRYQELQADAERFPRFLDDFHRTCGSIKLMRKPVIALVNGVTAAGGLELLLSCDLALAASSARIGDSHLTFGQMGGGGVLTLLPRMIGPARARELVLSGRMLSAAQARDWGIVSEVVDDAVLIDAGIRLADEIAAHSPLAVANAKQVMNTIWADGTGVEPGLRLERERTAFYCLTAADAREGLRAFAEKRPPRFKGA